ncbi:MAG: class I SAM-dependent methyltransferase [Congregibacter sp.]
MMKADDVSSPVSSYSMAAQFYDAVSLNTRDHVHQTISRSLQLLNSVQGPIVDIGAGTGLTTELIATADPTREVFAVEPDSAMRSSLMTRVCASPEMRAQISIIPMHIMDAPLPPRIAGAVLGASLVHFSPRERASLWQLLARRLNPRGVIIVEIQCAKAEAIPEVQIAATRVGRVDYICLAGAEKIAKDQQRWTLTYRATLDGSELATEHCIYDCWATEPEELAAEAKIAGLDAYQDDCLLILNPDLR